MHTRKTPRIVEGRDQGDDSTHEGMPEIARKSPKSEGEPGTNSSLQFSEETNPANTLILNFQPPELWDKKVLRLSHSVCGTYSLEILTKEFPSFI